MPKFTEAQIKEWLNDPSAIKLTKNDKLATTILTKIPLGDDFDAIFYQHSFGNTDFEIDRNLESAGLFCRKDGCVYNPRYYLKSCCEEISIFIEDSSKQDYKKELSDLIRSKVDSIIGNDRSRLSIAEIKSPEYRENINYFKKFMAADEAKKIFLYEKENFEIKFNCKFEIEQLSDETYLAFIKDRNTVVNEYANRIINDHQEGFLAQFIKNDYLQNELDKITENPDDILHKIKAIIKAVEKSGGKTVTVTICKEDENCTFKYEAAYLKRDPNGYYPSWNIIASDRHKFEDMYGRNARFYPEEITQITYGGKTIFEWNDSGQTEAFEQTM